MRALWFVLMVLLPILAMAGQTRAASAKHGLAFADMRPVDNMRLAALRGGFTISQGGVTVDVAMGVAQLTYIDGHLVEPASLNTAMPAATLRLIQNGPGNSFDPSGINLLPGTTATVIQNSLDQQVIRNVNVMNLTVTSMALAESLALQSSLQQALAGLSR